MKAPRAKNLVPLAAIAVLAWLFRVPLQEKIRLTGTLANDAPVPEAVEEMITQAADSSGALLAMWNSGKIVHREAAIRTLPKVVPPGEPMPPKLDAVLLSAALDPDLNVRESALGILNDRNHPALAALAAEQLRDPDPQVRQLGLRYLKKAPPELAVPLAASLLDDPDVSVTGVSLKLLERLSGEKFGAKLSDTVQIEDKQTGLQEFQAEGAAKVREAAGRAKQWWAASRSKFSAVQPQIPPAVRNVLQQVPAGDFQLATLDGKTVRLSDFRGKVVLINFWTTWCTACVGEMPALIALQNKHQDRLAILGVSLDYVPDSHGHIGGHAAVEEQSHSDGHHDDHEEAAAARKRVREKIIRTVKARRINYPILLDEKNEVGGRFNGGELPTTVIVDPEGNVRRRFVGARSLPVFEAMITEAARGRE